MKHKITIRAGPLGRLGCIIWLVLLRASSSLCAQTDQPVSPSPDLPHISFDALCFASDQPKMSRLDVYIEAPYETLHFTRDNDLFHSSYDITVSILDSVNKPVTEKFWTEKIETKDYEETVSPQAAKLSLKSFALPPGHYVLNIQVTDNDTKKTTPGKRKVTVRDFSGPPFSMSDLMLVNRITVEQGKKVIYPNITGNVADLTSGFFVFFEVYDHLGADSAQVRTIVRNVRGEPVRSDTFIQGLGAEKKPIFVKVDNTKLVAGEYMLAAEAVPLGSKIGSRFNEYTASAARPFVVHWRGIPVTITDLDLAIDEMQYIADKDLIDEMKKAPPDKKRQMFLDFWKKKDPTPSTERNELMEEYYSRVEYANKHFTHYVDGWKSDMGMVYIIFGPPSNIERHPFDIDSKPYEVWTYYDLNRQFVFVDASGFGDYRLQTPIWDVWRTRPR